MALYLIDPRTSRPVVVRARNGEEALRLSELETGDVIRLKDAGDPAVLWPRGEEQLSLDDAADNPKRQREPVEITSLSDRGVRKFMDPDTKETWTESRSPDALGQGNEDEEY